MKIRVFFVIFSCLIHPCFAFKTLLVDQGYIYEIYEPQDEIPSSTLNEGQSIYFESYLNPKLHKEIPLNAMRINASQFHSYDEFIQDMFLRDFESYQGPGQNPRFYLQARTGQDGKIIGVCAVLGEDNHNYHIDHLGVHKDFRQQGVATHLIKELLKTIPNIHKLSLDTRVFNKPAQAFYEKMGFKKLDVHPNPQKQSTYYHYILENPI